MRSSSSWPVAAALVMVIAGLTGCQTEPAPAEMEQVATAPSSDASPTATPSPTPTGFVTRREVGLDVGEPRPVSGPNAVIIDEQLYTADHAQPAMLTPDEGVDEERIDTRWAVQQNPEAPVDVVSVALIKTAASGLNTLPNHIRLQGFNALGTPSPPIELDPGITGQVEKIGWAPAAVGSDATLIDDILVLSTEVGSGLYALLGIEASTGAVLWQLESLENPQYGKMIVIDPKMVITNWDGAVSAFDPKTGVLIWANPEPTLAEQTSSPSYLLGYHYKGGSLRLSLIDPSTGAALENGFTDAIFDPVTGEAVVSFIDSMGFALDEKPLMRVYSSKYAIEYELPSSAADSLGSLELLGAFDGRTWISTSSGIDIVLSITGDREPTAPTHDQSAGTTYDVPVFGTRSWTVMHEFGYTSGYGLVDNDTTPYTLIRHPERQPTYEELEKIG